MAAITKDESAGLFLIEHGAQVNHVNKKGESPLHISASNGLVALVDKLLKWLAYIHLYVLLGVKILHRFK